MTYAETSGILLVYTSVQELQERQMVYPLIYQSVFANKPPLPSQKLSRADS